jgi:hypothetical protein
LYAIGHAYSGIHFNLPLLDELTILRFSVFTTLISSAKTTKDVPETRIPLLAPAGDVADNYATWSDKFIDFMSNYRSCYSGAPLSYLVCDEDALKLALLATYESLDKFVVALVQLDAAINPAFASENKQGDRHELWLCHQPDLTLE